MRIGRRTEKSLIFASADEPNRDIYTFDLKSRRVSAGYYSPHWSPDGRYISGTTFVSEKLMLFDTSTQKWTKPCDAIQHKYLLANMSLLPCCVEIRKRMRFDLNLAISGVLFEC